MKQDRDCKRKIKILFPLMELDYRGQEVARMATWSFKKVLTTGRGYAKQCSNCGVMIRSGEYRYANSGIDICLECGERNEVKT